MLVNANFGFTTFCYTFGVKIKYEQNESNNEKNIRAKSESIERIKWNQSMKTLNIHIKCTKQIIITIIIICVHACLYIYICMKVKLRTFDALWFCHMFAKQVIQIIQIVQIYLKEAFWFKWFEWFKWFKYFKSLKSFKSFKSEMFF